MFSKACQYGMRAAIYIAEKSMEDQRVGLKEIAKSIDSPEAFTSKILQQLAKAKIINSEKGPYGGFMMSPKNLEQIKLSHIVSAIDGNQIFAGCALGLKKCSEQQPCALHHDFKIIRDQIKATLEGTLIKTLALEHGDGLSFLKR